MKRLDYTGFKEHAFNAWSNEMAYWLGFFAADGNVPKKSNYINITLKYSDRDHLVKFKNFLGLREGFLRETKTTVNNKEFTQARLSFTSKVVKERLISLGIIPSKSQFDIDFTQYVPFEYMTPFLLGYFDGDGSYLGMNSDTRTIGIAYCGSYSFIKSVRDYFVTVYTFNPTSLYFQDDGMCYASWGSVKDVTSFANLHLSSLGSLPLERKLHSSRIIVSGEAYDNCLNCKITITRGTKNKLCSNCYSFERRKVIRPNKEELQVLLKSHSFSALGRRYEVSDNAVRKWAKTYGLL